MAGLGSLIITLGVDTATFQAGLGRANGYLQKHAADMERIGAQIGTAVGTSLAAGVAGFTALAKQAIDAGDKFNKLSQQVGISVESLSAINNAAKLSDVNIEQLGGSMAKLSRTVAEAAGGGKAQAAAFQAMGVSIKDAAGNVRPMEQILANVATKFSGYKDGAEKTALAQALFGRSGAQLLPLLNQLGDEGLAGVTAAAKEYNQVIGTEQAQQSEQFNDNLTRLSMAASGFANSIVKEMLPGLVRYSDQMAEAAKTTNGYADSTRVFAAAGKGVVLAAVAAKNSIEALVNVIFALGDTLGAAGDLYNGFSIGVVKNLQAVGLAMSGNFSAAREALDASGVSLAQGWEKATTRVRVAWDATRGGVLDAVGDVGEAYEALFGTFSNVTSGVETTAKKTRDGIAPIVALGNAGKETQKAFAKLAADGAAMDAFLDKLSGKVGGPYEKAWSEYAAALDQADKVAAKAREDHMQEAKVLDFLAKSRALATSGLQEQIDATSALDRIMDRVNGELESQRAGLVLTARQQEINETYTRLLADANQDLLTVMGPLTEADQKRLESLKAIATGMVDVREATERHNQEMQASADVAREWSGMFISAGHDISRVFSDVLVNGKSLFDGLKDIARNTVAAIVDYFGNLAIINPILNSLFGRSMVAGGGSMLPTLAQAGGWLGGSGTGGALDFTSTAGGATQNSILNAGSWINAGKNLWSGFSTGLSSFWNGTGGVSGYSGSFNMGGPSGVPGSPYGGSALGQGLGIAAGVYAGINRYGNRYDTGTGLAGAAAYGVGTYVAGAGLASAAAGTGFASAAGLGALGPIGWVALAAMLVDMISGGSLFGTGANKFKRGESDLNIGAGGASVSIGADYTGRKPLFGGSYHEWKNITPTQDQIDAANGFYRAILDQSTSFAKQFGQNVGEVATGTFRQIFDKNGNVTGSLSIVNGVEYQGEDQQAFAQRILAESMILDLKKIGVDISQYTQQFIKDAEAYAQAVQDSGLALQYANQDLKDGIDISGGKGLQGAFDTTLQYRDGSEGLTETYQRLSQEAQDLRDGIKLLTGQDTIESIEAFIRESQKVGETLTQTYVRLQQATAAYNSFVGQFAPQAEYVDDFEAALSGVYAQMQANIDQANALAKAAGLEGASVKDLTNIHAYAAKQFATLLAQLKDSARNLAYQMGLIGPYNLDQVNSEIADLEGRANAGANAVQDFGRTITDVANRANNAMQLLLGDLSPLNDQEKLQKALEGLRAGSVSQEEVLQIGRRLYASSEAYNQLFRQVQQFAPNPSTFGGGSYSSGANAGARGGLTEKERQRLQELYKQQAGLLAAQDYANAQTLARQIAEISAESGDDLDAILKEWGLSADDLAKRLHLENATQLDEYIEGQKKLVDSNGQNTTILADLLRQIRDLLSHGGTDFRSPGGRNTSVATMEVQEPRSESQLGRLNRNLDRIIVPPSRNRRAPGVPYP